MTRNRAIRARDRLAAGLSNLGEVLRGSLFERTIHHSSGCPKCAQALDRYREVKDTLEKISELNQFLARLDREESKGRERQP